MLLSSQKNGEEDFETVETCCGRQSEAEDNLTFWPLTVQPPPPQKKKCAQSFLEVDLTLCWNYQAALYWMWVGLNNQSMLRYSAWIRNPNILSFRIAYVAIIARGLGGPLQYVFIILSLASLKIALDWVAYDVTCEVDADILLLVIFVFFFVQNG